MIKWLISVALTMITLSMAAQAVELRDASDQQILDELSYRLRLGGGGGSGGAQAMFACDSGAYLRISVIGPNGGEAIESVYIGSASYCSSQARILTANRSRISDTSIIAICDSGAYLKRHSITRQGVMTELQSRYIGNMGTCLSQAETINTAF